MLLNYKYISPNSHVEISLNCFVSRCLPAILKAGKLTAPSAFPTFWNAIEIRAVCMAAGSCSSYCLNITECQGIYIACIYRFVVYRSRNRRDVWSRLCIPRDARTDRSVVSDVGRYAYSCVYARAPAEAGVKGVSSMCPNLCTRKTNARLYI